MYQRDVLVFNKVWITDTEGLDYANLHCWGIHSMGGFRSLARALQMLRLEIPNKLKRRTYVAMYYKEK